MAGIEVNASDIRGLKTTLAGIKNAVPRVLAVSINKSLKTAQVQAVKLIGQDLNLTAKRIKTDFYQKKANFSKPFGSLDHYSDPVGLVQFGSRQTRRGVSVKVKRNSTRKLIKHAYIAFRGRKDHVYWRDYDGDRKPLNKRQNYAAMPNRYRTPVKRLTGPRVGDIYGSPKVYNKVRAIALDAFAQNLARETQSVLRRYA